MWHVVTWHSGTLAIAWWAVVVLVLTALGSAGARGGRR